MRSNCIIQHLVSSGNWTADSTAKHTNTQWSSRVYCSALSFDKKSSM